MEFKLINPQSENGFIQAIEFNFDELKTELTERLEKYQNLTYTEDTIKDAKETRAGLNKFKEAIETRRKEIKNLCMKPYNDFEAKVKELTGLIDKPINAIDTQLKNFEETRKSAKQIDITNFYNSVIEDLAQLVPLERIFNPKWLNVTYKMATIQNEIIETIGKIKGDLNVITDLKLDQDAETLVKDKYLQTLDFSLAMAEKTRLENLKKAFKERETIQKVEVIQEEPQPTENEQETVAELENVVTLETEKIYYKEFFVRGTKNQILALRDFLIKNGIEYGGIKECQSQIA